MYSGVVFLLSQTWAYTLILWNSMALVVSDNIPRHSHGGRISHFFAAMPLLISLGSVPLSLGSQRASHYPNLGLTPNSDSLRRPLRRWQDCSRSAAELWPLLLFASYPENGTLAWLSQLGSHLGALAFSHALISDWLNWRAVTTKVGIKLTDSRYPGYLLMLVGKINPARAVNGESESVGGKKTKKFLDIFDFS